MACSCAPLTPPPHGTPECHWDGYVSLHLGGPLSQEVRGLSISTVRGLSLSHSPKALGGPEACPVYRTRGEVARGSLDQGWKQGCRVRSPGSFSQHHAQAPMGRTRQTCEERPRPGTVCVTLGKSVNLKEPQFSHLCNGGSKSTPSTTLL